MAQPQLRRTPQASREPSGGGSGSSFPVAGSTGGAAFAASSGDAANGCHASPTRTPYSWPSLTGGRPIGARSYAFVW